MPSTWAVIAIVWLAISLLAAVLIVTVKKYDIWAGIGLVCLGAWSLAAILAIRWIFWQ